MDKLYDKLLAEGVAVTRYHAGLDGGERRQNQEDFIYDKCPVMIATNAFSMGIDKSNVRYVIHYNMPQILTWLLFCCLQEEEHILNWEWHWRYREKCSYVLRQRKSSVWKIP